jgi:outer membrane protein insertion porin family
MIFKRIRKQAAFAMLVGAFYAANTWAVEPFELRDIRVEGLQRVEAGTVFASIPVRVGDTYSDDKGLAAIRSLFALGLFTDVRLEINGNVLVVIVEERPTIADVEFVGAKEFDKDVLKKALRDVGLTDGRPFDKALVDRAEQELKRQYINRSLYAAEVVTTVTPIERNRVNLVFNMTEGEPAKINEIRIVGNTSFSESTLRNLFDLNTSGWLSWYTKADRYSRAKLNADMESLRSYYLARGYLEFKIESTQVAISPNKQDIAITINVAEGERFVVAGIKLDGNFLGKEEEFKSLITIRPGEAYNADLVTQTSKAFTDYYGNFGYAFARVDARPEIDRANNRVTLTLVGDPSRRAYVRLLNVAGNTRTRDEVVRREFRQFESSWYDAAKIKLSRDRVDRLGYFKEVTMDTREVPGTVDQVDLTVNVVEKPTGSLTLGAGFSSSDGLGLSFGLKQDNAFGSGNSLGVQVNTSKINSTLVFSTTDPYFTKDGVSRSIDLYSRTSTPYQDQSYYQLVTTGGSLRFGVPFTESDTVYFGLGIENTKIIPGTSLPDSYLSYANQFGFVSNTIPLTVGWARDRRDSALAPSSGVLQRLSGEWGIAGDVRYLRATYQYQQFYPFTKQLTGAFNVDLGWGTGLADRPYPIFKNFYGGGLGSVRGFEQSSLGPRDLFNNTALGGTKKININTELLVPFPGAGNDRSLRLYAFYDMGNVFGADENFDFSSLRSSTGIGISWISPVGPLRLAFAKPLRSYDGDKIQTLQFQIGTSF